MGRYYRYEVGYPLREADEWVLEFATNSLDDALTFLGALKEWHPKAYVYDNLKSEKVINETD